MKNKNKENAHFLMQLGNNKQTWLALEAKLTLSLIFK